MHLIIINNELHHFANTTVVAVYSVTRITCSPQCEGRCFGPNPQDCCNSECAGGCTGPTKSECWVSILNICHHNSTGHISTNFPASYLCSVYYTVRTRFKVLIIFTMMMRNVILHLNFYFALKASSESKCN